KFVGEQFMGNTNTQKSKLKSYLTHDVNIVYEIPVKKWFQSISINVLANNILNTKYISNGFYYTYDDDWSVPNTIITKDGAGYYPQAQFNILAGVSLKF